eukprot:EG_transcript_32926
MADKKVDPVKQVREDFENSQQWPLTCYASVAEHQNEWGGDVSPEELHWQMVRPGANPQAALQQAKGMIQQFQQRAQQFQQKFGAQNFGGFGSPAPAFGTMTPPPASSPFGTAFGQPSNLAAASPFGSLGQSSSGTPFGGGFFGAGSSSSAGFGFGSGNKPSSASLFGGASFGVSSSSGNPFGAMGNSSAQ